jgi:hypothetical protein
VAEALPDTRTHPTRREAEIVRWDGANCGLTVRHTGGDRGFGLFADRAFKPLQLLCPMFGPVRHVKDTAVR